MPQPTPAQALAEAQRIAATGIFLISLHATGRMKKRGAKRADVRAAILSAVSATWQPVDGTWRLDGGADLDGDALVVAVVLDGGMLVATIFG